MKQTAIILNGASSAGKTLISTELFKCLGDKTLLTGFDDILDRQNAESNFFSRLIQHFDRNFRTNTFRRLHTEILEHLQTGRNVIVETSIMEIVALRDLSDKLSDQQVFFIGIKPPLHISEKWEKQRGDRPIGQARKHYELIHQHGIYDLVMDTSQLTPVEAAEQILTHINKHKPFALRQLKQMI